MRYSLLQKHVSRCSAGITVFVRIFCIHGMTELGLQHVSNMDSPGEIGNRFRVSALVWCLHAKRAVIINHLANEQSHHL